MFIVTPLEAISLKRKSTRIKAKATTTNPYYEPEHVEVFNDVFDKANENVAPSIATKAKKAIPKVTISL